MSFFKTIFTKPVGGVIVGISKDEKSSNYGSLYVENWAFRSCAMSVMYNFGCGKIWDTPQEFFSDLYKAHKVSSGTYTSWNFMYILGHSQYTHPDQLHKWMMECGSKQIDVFPNEAHGGNPVYIFRFNLKGAIGKYIDEKGNPINEVPKSLTTPKEQNASPQITINIPNAAAAPIKAIENPVTARRKAVKVGV